MPKTMPRPVERAKVTPKPAPNAKGSRKKNLSLNAASLSTLNNLRATTDAGSDAEVVRRALRFYEMAVAKEQAGAQIVFKDPDGNDTPVIFL